MIKELTHQGRITACSKNHIRPNFDRVRRLRETEFYWVDRDGTKYRKADGFQCGPEPFYQLHLDTVTSL